MSECHRLRRVQLGLLTVENLRLLIGQNIAEGDFWQSNRAARDEVEAIFRRASDLAASEGPAVQRALEKAWGDFRNAA